MDKAALALEGLRHLSTLVQLPCSSTAGWQSKVVTAPCAVTAGHPQGSWRCAKRGGAGTRKRGGVPLTPHTSQQHVCAREVGLRAHTAGAE